LQYNVNHYTSCDGSDNENLATIFKNQSQVSPAVQEPNIYSVMVFYATYRRNLSPTV